MQADSRQKPLLVVASVKAVNTKSRIHKANKQAANKVYGTIKRKSTTRAPKSRLTDEQRRKLKQVRTSEERQRRKKLGLSREYPNVATEVQTLCPARAGIDRCCRWSGTVVEWFHQLYGDP